MFGKKKEVEAATPEVVTKVVDAPLTLERVLEAVRNKEVHELNGGAIVFAYTTEDGEILMGGGGNPAHVLGIGVNLIQQTGRPPKKEEAGDAN